MYGQGLGSRDYEVFGLLQEFTVYDEDCRTPAL